MKTEGIHRVVVVVKDLENAVKRWSELLRMDFIDFGVQEGYGVRAMVSLDWSVELIQPTDPKSYAGRFLERAGEGVIGVAFMTDDLEKAKANAVERGFRLIGEADFGSVDIWKSYREIMLHGNETNGAPVVLVQAELK
ncbi:VOC family protein [Chloroflexota bacterium]